MSKGTGRGGAPARVRVSGLRTLGRPGGLKAAPPKRTKAEAAAADRARRVLRAEFRKAMALKAALDEQARAEGPAKGREPSREKIRSIVASLEGMSRFAIAMGILTPAENRAIWTQFIKRGLYEGWR